MGSSKTGVRHLVQGNVAWKNKAAGFYANHSSGGNTWYNNTSFQNNGTQYNMLASPPDMPDVTITLTGALAHIMRNNIGFPNRNTNMTGVDTMFNTLGSGHHAGEQRLPQRHGSQRLGHGHEHRVLGRASGRARPTAACRRSIF